MEPGRPAPCSVNSNMESSYVTDTAIIDAVAQNEDFRSIFATFIFQGRMVNVLWKVILSECLCYIVLNVYLVANWVILVLDTN